MSVDDRIRHSMRHVAATSDTDLDHTLETLRGRSRVSRRTAVLVATAAVVAVIALPAVVLRTTDDRSEVSGGAGIQIDNRLSVTALSLHRPLAVATGPAGDFYVSDSSSRISHYSVTGELLARWGSPGPARGELRLVTGSIAVGPHDRLYVADTGNARIDVFTPKGRLVTSYGSFGRALGKYLWPTDVTVDAAGNIYVADQRRATITMLDPTGVPRWRIGALNSFSLDSAWHLGRAADSGGVIAVSEVTGAIANVDQKGAVTPVGTSPAAGSGTRFCGVSRAGDGVVLVSTCASAQGVSRVLAYDAADATWKRVALSSVPDVDDGSSGWALSEDRMAVVHMRLTPLPHR